MQLRKPFIAFVATLIICAYFAVPAVAIPGHSFGYYWAKGENGQTWLDTQPVANNVAVGFNNSGYSTSLLYNRAAGEPRNAIGGDAVFFIYSHAKPGGVYAKNDTWFTALDSPPMNIYSLQLKYGNTGNRLQNVRLAIIGGCDTNFTDSINGSFPNTLTNYWVDSHLTFAGTISLIYVGSDETGIGYYFNNVAWYLSQGDDVQTADALSRMDEINRNGFDVGGAGKSRIGGAEPAPGSVKITPAQWGR